MDGCDKLLAVTSNKYVAALTAVHTVATAGTKKERFWQIVTIYVHVVYNTAQPDNVESR